ncbi:MAG TPA: bifunctional pyr operon transcriptional regulator/uracil phosphoribosyltransferase PyrR [Verrucomicrobiales bacterium]|nr:bifunctional pyr operon transcriptional regulator/uracil phosphoribosyltransferase PyrR [Verrucomicrobiales bacterium]|tara:strand:+ start:3331 stop:3864 length:534 start_codon:yes stop_codon:yes gene_type:complete
MPDERIVLEAADLGRAWRRVAHEIVEAHTHGSSLMLVGIQRGGVALAQQLSKTLAGLCGHPVAIGSVEPGLHRDDLSQRGMSELRSTELPGDLAGQTVVLVDDVLSTGRTVRASIDALLGFGRPKCIRLAALIDRGHRELPIRPDFVGKNLPTHPDERVEVRCDDRGAPEAVVLQTP